MYERQKSRKETRMQNMPQNCEELYMELDMPREKWVIISWQAILLYFYLQK